MLPGTVLLIVFSVFPVIGLWMASSKYQPVYDRGYFYALFHGAFVGFGFFEQIFSRPDFLNVVWNSIYISFDKIVLLIVFGVALALLLNEISNLRLKKAVQTIVFIPYFLSWAIMATMIIGLLSVDGPISAFLALFGIEPISFLACNRRFRIVLFVS